MVVRRLSNDELYHHGVEGQKWGVQHGPPYPLNASGSSLRKQKKLMKKQQKEINKVKKIGERVSNSGYDKKDVNEALQKRIKSIEKYYDLKMRSVNDHSIETSKEMINALKNYKVNKLGIMAEATIRGDIETSRIDKAAKKGKTGLTINDIDDKEMIDLYIDDPNFRKEYNITDTQYKKYKKG